MKNIAKILCFVLSLVLAFALIGLNAFADDVTATPIAKVNDENYFDLQLALNAAAAGSGNVVVEILADIDLTDVEWVPVTVSAPNYPVVTVNGNNHKITGLNNMLFAGTWAGTSGLIINDLTIADSDIQNDVNDAKGTVGVGAFVGFPQASANVTLNNCHLVNSKVSGGHWTGGLVGYAAGYAGNDGPVFMTLTIKDCSVIGNTITGKGSVGGVIGHGAGNAWTKVVITNTVIENNTVTSTGSSNNKAGSVVGTIGAAGQATTVNGVTHTGGIVVDANVSGNTVKSNETVITTIYGRQGSTGGVLTITEGTYDTYPMETGKTYALTAEGFKIMPTASGSFGMVSISATPEIGANGNWWIGDVDTGMVAYPGIELKDCAEHGVMCWYVKSGNGTVECVGQAVGVAGTVPNVQIIDGYWYIDNHDNKGLLPTGVKAVGTEGLTITSVHRDMTKGDELVSVYVITFSNGYTWTFSVTNGVDGVKGFDGAQGLPGAKGETGDQGVEGVDGNKNNETVIIVVAIATVCIAFALAVVLHRDVDRRSWWCTR